MAAADAVDLEIRSPAHVGSDLAGEMAADETHVRSAELDAASRSTAEIGIGAVSIEPEAEPDQNSAARPGARIFARLQTGSLHRPCRERENGNSKIQRWPPRMHFHCHDSSLIWPHAGRDRS